MFFMRRRSLWQGNYGTSKSGSIIGPQFRDYNAKEKARKISELTKPLI